MQHASDIPVDLRQIDHRVVDEVGAGEIRGLDCGRPWSDRTMRAVRDAWGKTPILVFRDQALSVDQLVAFTRQFGELEITDRLEYTHPDNEAVLVLSNELRPDGTAVGVVDAGDYLHTDMQFDPKPAIATILQSVRNPQTGGDTDFCNMYLVHDALPDDLRRRLAGKRAINHSSKLRNKRVTVSAARPNAAAYYKSAESLFPDVAHPVIRTHPETGRQAIYVSPRFSLFIEGIDEAESDELLDAVFAVMKERRFHYRHRWQTNDLVMWDNRCLTHRATGGYDLPDIRRMHRTQVQGDVPCYRP